MADLPSNKRKGEDRTPPSSPSRNKKNLVDGRSYASVASPARKKPTPTKPTKPDPPTKVSLPKDVPKQSDKKMKKKKKKERCKNEPNLNNKFFKNLCRTNDEVVKKYSVDGAEFDEYNKMGCGTSEIIPIKPKTDQDEKHKLELEEEYEEKMKLMEEAIENNDESVDVDELAAEAQVMKDELVELEDYLKSYNKILNNAKQAREKAKLATNYWRKKDPRLFVKWRSLVATLDKLLIHCDEEEKRIQAAEAEAVAVVMQAVNEGNEEEEADDNTNGDVLEIIEINDDEGNDGASDADDNEALELPKQARGERKVRKKKGIAPPPGSSNLCSLAQFQTQLNGGRHGRKAKLHDQCLQWNNGIVNCLVCGVRIKKHYAMDEHCETDTHKKNLARKESGEKKRIQKVLDKVDRSCKSTDIDDPHMEFRTKALIAAARANISVSALVEICNGFVEEYSNRTIGDPGDLLRVYAQPLLDTLLEEIRETICGDACYDEFSICFDGTPSFAEAEAVAIRVVTKDHHIRQFVIRVGLYDKKLDANNLKKHIIHAIKIRAGKKMKDWMATQNDRASVNKSALNDIVDSDENGLKDANPTKNPCCSHGINNSGKKVLGKDGSAKHAEKFRKSVGAVIKHPGKARDKYAEILKRHNLGTPQLPGSIRFFNNKEMVDQMHGCTPEELMVDLIEFCIDNKCSKESAASMKKEFGRDVAESRACLGMAILELAAVSCGLKSVAESCYQLEGDGPNMLILLRVLERLEGRMAEDFSNLDIDDAVNRALALIKSALDEITSEYESAEELVASKQSSVDETNEKLKSLKEENDNIRGGTSNSGRRRQRTAATLTDEDIDNIERIAGETATLKVELKYHQKALKDAKDNLNEKKERHDKFNSTYPAQTKETLLEHAKQLLAPCTEYYKDLFQSEEGDNHDMRVMAEAAQIFNPIFLATLSDADVESTLHFLADKLVAFGYRHFNPRFIKDLKNEMHDVVREAKRDHDLGRLKASDKYKTRLQRRIKRKKDTVDDFKKDPGEYAERIWQWWGPRKKMFPKHYTAIRLVVLTQTSSCFVERVFSKLKLIRDAVGDNMLEDITEIRVLVQCND